MTLQLQYRTRSMSTYMPWKTLVTGGPTGGMGPALRVQAEAQGADGGTSSGTKRYTFREPKAAQMRNSLTNLAETVKDPEQKKASL